ncbi:hypothetical protein PRIPAC_78572 [Pristionchus pacificus]|uniref:DB domain-containing protein n=1 Tax=Pristionchus pacificus TaxID=54126 RepID=A0A454XUR9_PRIPA|nr:hypothetical protein PRIPAC_78572 [Pristionchus pacificus]|eukprot:PDM79415.1 hypothetical protein PRIPAC_31994 [Pristionchus pacificus]
MRSLILFALLGSAAVFACSSKPSGGCGCGGGGGGGGGCGGCKHKARGVLRLEGDNPVDEDFGEIFGLGIWESPKLPANVSIQQAHDPNFLFATCCSSRGLSTACQSRCNYGTYNQELLQKMLIGVDECPLDSLPEMHFCSAQGRDHSSCCRVKGVDATDAGDKCLVFCDQTPDKYTPIDYTYASCFGKFDEMKQCFFGTVAHRARAYFRQQ